MKYILKPSLKIILATLLTICWLIPTLILNILYFIFTFIWEFKIYIPKLKKYYQIDNDLSYEFLWSDSEEKVIYNSYFHCIWNIQNNKSIMVQIINKINNKLNLN